jgi:hypothetical protein
VDVNTRPRDSLHEKRESGRAPGIPAAKKDYWHLAIDQLQQEDLSVAHQIAAVQHAARENGDVDFVAQLLSTTKQTQADLEHKKSKISIGSREYLLRDQVDKLVRAVTSLKEIATAAASIDPVHAGLPVAGLCVLMQVGLVITLAHLTVVTNMHLDGD